MFILGKNILRGQAIGILKYSCAFNFFILFDPFFSFKLFEKYAKLMFEKVVTCFWLFFQLFSQKTEKMPGSAFVFWMNWIFIFHAKCLLNLELI